MYSVTGAAVGVPAIPKRYRHQGGAANKGRAALLYTVVYELLNDTPPLYGTTFKLDFLPQRQDVPAVTSTVCHWHDLVEIYH